MGPSVETEKKKKKDRQGQDAEEPYSTTGSKDAQQIDNSLLQHNQSHSLCQNPAIFKQPETTNKKAAHRKAMRL